MRRGGVCRQAGLKMEMTDDEALVNYLSCRKLNPTRGSMRCSMENGDKVRVMHSPCVRRRGCLAHAWCRDIGSLGHSLLELLILTRFKGVYHFPVFSFSHTPPSPSPVLLSAPSLLSFSQPWSTGRVLLQSPTSSVR